MFSPRVGIGGSRGTGNVDSVIGGTIEAGGNIFAGIHQN